MFQQSLVKPNSAISLRILLPNSGEDQKKKIFAAFWFYLSRNFRFLVAKRVLLAKKLKGPDIFHPLQCQTQGGAAPTKLTPMFLDLTIFTINVWQATCLVFESCSFACS